MTIADRKLHENIAEYILFVWQMEDLARAVKFNPEAVRTMYEGASPEVTEAEVTWFTALCDLMKKEGLEKKGHIPDLAEIMKELFYLHSNLLTIIKDQKYIDFHQTAQPILSEFLVKTGSTTNHEVEAYLVALYGMLILKLKSEEISEGTKQAMESFSKVVAYLSQEYHKMKRGEMNVSLN
jgi:hypothetical protein